MTSDTATQGPLVPTWALLFVGLLLQLLVPSVVIVSTKSLFGWEDISDISMGAAFTGLVSGWLAVAGLLYFVAFRDGVSVSERFGLSFHLRDLVFVPLGALLQFSMVAIYWPVLQIIDGADVEEVAQELGDQARASGSIGVLFLVIAAVVVAPLMEEIFFRGLLFGLLKSALSPLVAVLVSAAVFGAIHFQALQFLGLFVVGVATAYSVHRSEGRLGPAVALHAGFNATTLIAVLMF